MGDAAVPQEEQYAGSANYKARKPEKGEGRGSRKPGKGFLPVMAVLRGCHQGKKTLNRIRDSAAAAEIFPGHKITLE
jgi:hypothetical protein